MPTQLMSTASEILMININMIHAILGKQPCTQTHILDMQA